MSSRIEKLTGDGEKEPSPAIVHIAVMGLTGAGKTSFVNTASGSELEVGHGLSSCTQGVQAAPNFQLDGRAIHLIDTPGFDDTDRSEVQVLKTIADYLKDQYTREIKLQGVIYLYGIDATRMGGMSKRAFRLFRKICGTETLDNVSIVTTKWSRVTDEEGSNRESELQTKYFDSALKNGAKMHRHDDTRESAQQLLRTFLHSTARALSLQKELVVEQKRVFKTEAGIHVKNDLDNLIKQVEREAKVGTDTASSQKLEEYLRDLEQIHRSETSGTPPQGPREGPKSVSYTGEGMQPDKEAPLHDLQSTAPLSEREARPEACIPSTVPHVGKALTDISGPPRFVVGKSEARNGSSQSTNFNPSTHKRSVGAPLETVLPATGRTGHSTGHITGHISPHKSSPTTLPQNIIGMREVGVTNIGGPNGPIPEVRSEQNRRNLPNKPKEASNEVGGGGSEPVGAPQSNRSETPRQARRRESKQNKSVEGEQAPNVNHTMLPSIDESHSEQPAIKEIVIPSEGPNLPVDLGGPATSALTGDSDPSALNETVTPHGEGREILPNIIGEVPKRRQLQSPSPVGGRRAMTKKSVDGGEEQAATTLSNGMWDDSGPIASPVSCEILDAEGDRSEFIKPPPNTRPGVAVPRLGAAPSEGGERRNDSTEVPNKQQKPRLDGQSRTPEDEENPHVPTRLPSSGGLHPVSETSKVSPTPSDKGKTRDPTPLPLVTPSNASKLKESSTGPGGEPTPSGQQAPKEVKTQITSEKTVTIEGAKKEYLASTINIAVMGVSGAGKTSFVNIASGSDLKVGHGLDSCTQGVQVAPSFWLDGHIINLIDTPGFDDTDRSEVELLKIFANFFGEQYSRNIQLQGVIYLHNIDTNRMGSMSRRAFALFKEICGITNLRNVTIVTTRWDKVTTEQGETREKELKEKYFKSALEGGANIQRGNSKEYLQLLRTFLNNTPRALNLQTELVIDQKHVFTTKAGIHVQNDLNNLIQEAEMCAEAGTDTALDERLERYRRDRDEIRQPNASNARAQGSEPVPHMGEGTQPWKEAPLYIVPSTSPFSEQGARPEPLVLGTMSQLGPPGSVVGGPGSHNGSSQSTNSNLPTRNHLNGVPPEMVLPATASAVHILLHKSPSAVKPQEVNGAVEVEITDRSRGPAPGTTLEQDRRNLLEETFIPSTTQPLGTPPTDISSQLGTSEPTLEVGSGGTGEAVTNSQALEEDHRVTVPSSQQGVGVGAGSQLTPRVEVGGQGSTPNIHPNGDGSRQELNTTTELPSMPTRLI